MSNTGPTIASILEGKAKEVYVTPAAASIREAAKVMAEHNIGLLATTLSLRLRATNEIVRAR